MKDEIKRDELEELIVSGGHDPEDYDLDDYDDDEFDDGC
jgi:hypothetical protein